MKITTALRLGALAAASMVATLSNASVISFSQTEYDTGEGDGSVTISVTVDRSNDPDPGARISVDYQTLSGSGAGTATPGSDYQDVSGTLVFEAGQTVKSFSVPILEDGALEASETFSAILTNPSAEDPKVPPDPARYATPTFGTSKTTVRIFDNDRANTVQFSPSNYSGNEAGAGGQDGQVTLTVTATRIDDPTTTITVNYSTSDDSAVANVDYRPTSGTVSFAPGETHKQITVTLVNDLFIEDTKRFRVNLSAPSGAILGGAGTASVNVDDDDGGTSNIEFAASNYAAGEADGAAVLTVVRSGGIGFAVTARYATSDGSAVGGQDYQSAAAGQVSFQPGEYSKNIRIDLFQDPAVESSENFFVTLSTPSVNAAIGQRSTANVTILDDEGPPAITSPATSSGQRGQYFEYRITATNAPTSYGASGLPSGLSIDTATGLISGTPNDFGTFQVQISATNSKGTGTATLTISIASGETTTVQFRSDFYTVTDPQASVTLIVDLARAPGEGNEEVTVDYATSDGSAKAGVDYQPQAGTLVFAPGQKTQTITIAITPRDEPGPDRTFFVDLFNPSRGTLGRSRATVVSTHPDLSTKLLNISTRAPVRSGDEVMIAGFIIEGSVPKEIVLRGIGPSLTAMEVPAAIDDPTLTLMDSNGSQIAFNDNYEQNSADDQQTLNDNSLAPEDSRESAIVATLAPGSYTAVLRGKSNGNGLVEVYDIGNTSSSRFVNIATRSRVNEGDNGAMIAGFIVGAPDDEPGTPQRVVIRGIGTSLREAGIDDVLEDPTLEIYRGSDKILENDDWKSDQRQELQAVGLAPTKDREAAIVADLEPGSYSAVIRGKSNTTGVALAEVYQLNQ